MGSQVQVLVWNYWTIWDSHHESLVPNLVYHTWNKLYALNNTFHKYCNQLVSRFVWPQVQIFFLIIISIQIDFFLPQSPNTCLELMEQNFQVGWTGPKSKCLFRTIATCLAPSPHIFWNDSVNPNCFCWPKVQLLHNYWNKISKLVPWPQAQVLLFRTCNLSGPKCKYFMKWFCPSQR